MLKAKGFSFSPRMEAALLLVPRDLFVPRDRHREAFRWVGLRTHSLFYEGLPTTHVHLMPCWLYLYEQAALVCTHNLECMFLVGHIALLSPHPLHACLVDCAWFTVRLTHICLAL